jgi:hypothetical protein
MVPNYRQLITGLAVLALLAFAPNAMAECTGDACDDVKIERLFPDASWNTVWVTTDGTETNLQCTASGGVYLGLLQERAMFDPMYTALLEGLLAQKTFFIRVARYCDPPSPGCNPQIDRNLCVITGVHLNR